MASQPDVHKMIEMVARLSVDKASQVFSKFLKKGAHIELERAYMADITDISSQMSMKDDEIIASIIDLTGAAPFRFLFYVDLPGTLTLTDLILRRKKGTTKEFDKYAISAVQEIGNILASAITNVFASNFGISIKPEPPEVIRDYVGTVFEQYILSVALEQDEIMIIESQFQIVQNDVDCSMFIMPMHGSEETLSQILNGQQKIEE